MKCPYCGQELKLIYFEEAVLEYHPRLNGDEMDYGEIIDFWPKEGWWECSNCEHTIVDCEDDAIDLMRGNICMVCANRYKCEEEKREPVFATECAKYKPVY
jgi:hypothetical protein